MHLKQCVFLGFAAFAVTILGTHAVRADYIFGQGADLGIERITDSGALVRYYSPPPKSQYAYESSSQDYAVTPDFQIVYDFTNSLGYSNYIFANDVQTGQLLPNKYLHSGFGQP